MANGDAAAAAGFDTVASSASAQLGYDEINKTRDYVAAVKTQTYTVGKFTGTGYFWAGTPTPQAVKYPDGRVFLEGEVGTDDGINFEAGTGYTIGSIPVAFAPTADTILATLANFTSVAWVTVTTAGTVTLLLGTTFTGALDLPLNGLSWRKS